MRGAWTHFDPQSVIGNVYNKWTVVEFVRRDGSQWMFRCRCECGNESVIPLNNLKRGVSKSCGHCIEPRISSENNYFRYVCVNGDSFIFDAADYELVADRRWGINPYGYPVNQTKDGCVFLSRLLMNASDDEYVDHINNDTRDNRRHNLRISTWQQNNQNKVLQSNNTSGYKGVYFHKRAQKYVAEIHEGGKKYYLGLFPTAEEAAFAYDEMARELHGEFARLNFPREGERGCREAV